MIKPVSEGSSIGMSKVNSKVSWKKRFNTAKNYNSEVMLEEYVSGKSMTVGVLDLEDNTIAISNSLNSGRKQSGMILKLNILMNDRVYFTC